MCMTQLRLLRQQGNRDIGSCPPSQIVEGNTCDLLDYIISCSLERQTLHLNNAIASKA